MTSNSFSMKKFSEVPCIILIKITPKMTNNIHHHLQKCAQKMARRHTIVVSMPLYFTTIVHIYHDMKKIQIQWIISILFSTLSPSHSPIHLRSSSSGLPFLSSHIIRLSWSWYKNKREFFFFVNVCYCCCW